MSPLKSDSQSPTTPRPAAPSAHMRSIAYILRQAARWETDPENRSTYAEAAHDLEQEADKVDALSSRIRELEAALEEALPILELAEFYSPGELAEFPDRVRKAVEEAQRLVGGAS